MNRTRVAPTTVAFALSLAVALLALTVLLGGCATPLVRPWERDLLSEKAMTFDPQPMMNTVDDHIYFSREGSTGGQNVSGGGCGCN